MYYPVARLSFLLFLILVTLSGFGQNFLVKGTVMAPDGSALPYANVFVSGSSLGVASNEDGAYSLKLPAGKHTLVCRYIGYALKEKVVDVKSELTVNFTLEPENLLLDTLVISAGEDPGMEVMRRAISRRKDHLHENDAFSVDVYIKGLQRIVSAPDKILGISIEGVDALDSNNSGIVYLSESESRYSFRLPDEHKEIMYSSRVSGDDQGFSYNEAGAMEMSFYENKLSMSGLSERAFISPVAENAFFYYRYILEGTFMEKGRLINKIKVLPKRKADPVFRGHIYIVEDRWNIHSTDLVLTRASGIEFADSLRFLMSYAEQKNGSWMPLSRSFSFKFGLLGVRGEGYFMGFYRNYDLDPEFPKGYFGPEIMRIEEGSNERDSSYWADIRPIPLTEIERADYEAKDSLALLRQQPEYLDSLDKLSNQFTPWFLLTGYSWRKSSKKLTFQIAPPATLIGYNTVEGWKLGLNGSITKEVSKRNSNLYDRRHILKLNSRYGLSNKRFNASLDWRYDYKQERFAFFRLAGGSGVSQFNQEGISELVNSIYSLYRKENFFKIYESRFALAEWQYELANGFFLRTSGSWAERIPLENTSFSTWREVPDRSFTPNLPAGQEFERSHTFRTDLRLLWRPGQTYMVEPGRKYIVESDWPDFIFDLRRAWGLTEQSPVFTELVFALRDERSMGLFGSAQFQARLGSFIGTQENLGLPDLRHFPANQTVIASAGPYSFQLLNYYSHSTTDWFTDLHYVHHFNGFIFNKLPYIRKLKLQAVVAGRALYVPEAGSYYEFSAGIEHILKIGRVDFVVGKAENKPTDYGLVFGIGF